MKPAASAVQGQARTENDVDYKQFPFRDQVGPNAKNKKPPLEKVTLKKDCQHRVMVIY